MRLDTGHTSNEDDDLPPVRAAIKPSEVIDSLKTTKSNSNSNRIASSDYNQWEKYDAGMIYGKHSHFLASSLYDTSANLFEICGIP